MGSSLRHRDFVSSGTAFKYPGFNPESLAKFRLSDEEWTATSPVYDQIRKEVVDLKCRVISLENKKNETIYSVKIYDLASPELSLKKPLLIVIEKYDDEYIARVPELEVFGSASTESEAIMNLKQEIKDLHDDLKQTKEEDLGLLPSTWKRVLKELIREKR